MVTTIYLVRHAEAEGNARKIFQGRIDLELTQKGIDQAWLLNKRFKAIDYDIILSSPLSRAFNTAKIINDGREKEISKIDELAEINAGVFEGISIADIEKLYPADAKAWSEALHSFKPEGSEGTAGVYERISHAIDKIASENVGKTIVITSHGLAIKSYLSYAMFGDVAKISDVDWFTNTAVAKIIYDDSLKPSVEFYGDVSHLE